MMSGEERGEGTGVDRDVGSIVEGGGDIYIVNFRLSNWREVHLTGIK